MFFVFLVNVYNTHSFFKNPLSSNQGSSSAFTQNHFYTTFRDPVNNSMKYVPVSFLNVPNQKSLTELKQIWFQESNSVVGRYTGYSNFFGLDETESMDQKKRRANFIQLNSGLDQFVFLINNEIESFSSSNLPESEIREKIDKALSLLKEKYVRRLDECFNDN